MWYDLTVRQRTDAVGAVAEVSVPADSRWFDGHFPGNPVLPGIAQLSMVLALIEAAFGQALIVRGVSRVRFKQMILPGERLAVWADPKSEQPGVVAFRITNNEQLVCTGNMTVAADSEHKR